MVEQDSEMPADLVFLSSADPDSLCYVETANLDGETNLKLKYSYSRTARAESTADLEAALDGRYIECELPNEKLYQVCSAADGNALNCMSHSLMVPLLQRIRSVRAWT